MILPKTLKPLKGKRILSLCLNLPGPAAIMRMKDMGAKCTKIEPKSPSGFETRNSTDPMARYQPEAYKLLHTDVKVIQLDLKKLEGQTKLHKLLKETDVLLTSFRPSALKKLKLTRTLIKRCHPHLSWIAIVGEHGSRAEYPGHDLTYLAENGMVDGLNLPASLFADMAGSLMVTEAVLTSLMLAQVKNKGQHREVALSNAAHYLGLPRQWGLTGPKNLLGGIHAGYNVYQCKDGRVAIAALEIHFIQRLIKLIGLAPQKENEMESQFVHKAASNFFKKYDRNQLKDLSTKYDFPLCAMP